jgi:hypothetical protein
MSIYILNSFFVTVTIIIIYLGHHVLKRST